MPVAEGVVLAPPAEVYALVSDPAAFAKAIRPGIKFQPDDSGPAGTQRVKLEDRVSGDYTINSTISVIELIEDQRVVTHDESVIPGLKVGSFGTLEGRRVVSLEPHADGTLVRVENDWRLKPAVLGIPLRWLTIKHRQRRAEETVRALQRHFGVDGSTEFGVDYEWTRADTKAVRRWLLWSSRSFQFWFRTFLIAVFFEVVNGPAFLLLSGSTGLALIVATVRTLSRRRPLEAEGSTRLAIGGAGVRFTTADAGAGGISALCWGEFSAVNESSRYLILLEHKPEDGSRFIPKRAFDSVPNGVDRLLVIAANGGIGDDAPERESLVT
jgi:hypothetical protein